MKTITKRILAGILAFVMVIGTITGLPIQSVKADVVNHLIINQVYGGGGKSDTSITNSFIELYNPTTGSISLNGYSIVCGSDKLDLLADVSIEAGSSYLIVCNAETTTDNLITYDLPAADQEWGYTINNKSYKIDLKNGESIIDSAVADENVSALKISKQKSLRRINYSDTDTNDDWQIVVWEKSSVTVDEDYVKQYAPRNSKGEMGNVHSVSQEPVYTPVNASDNKVTGVNNGNSSLDMELFARHNSGAISADGGSLEIVEYNSLNGYAYAVSGLKGKVIAVKVSDVKNGEKVTDLPGTEYDVKELVAEKAASEGFVYGDTTSVAISPDGTKLAAAIQHADYDKAGVVAVFECNADGTLTNPTLINTGVQPDMVVFADNNTVLTADEGEPRNGYGNGTVDPKGTVSIINIADKTSVQAGFGSFTADELVDKNIILGIANGEVVIPETDLEPEYIAVSSNGKKAYVSLQEANAIGVLDIETKQFTGIYSVGFEDYSKVAVDIVEDSKYEAKTYENLVGARMPDGNDFERLSAEAFPEYFNCSNDDNKVDSRSPKKGPEPENVTVGQVNGRTYAFIALERVGGIMVYDITNPEDCSYVNYINSREFEKEIQGDISPEGICFIASNNAGSPIILTACEVSGTMAAYELKSNIKQPVEESTTQPSTEPTTKPSGTHTAHISEVRNAKTATYFTKGYSGDTYCKVCGKLLKKGTNIAKKTLKKPVVKVKAGKKKVTVSYKRVKGAKYYQIKIKYGKKWKSVQTKKLKSIIKKLKTGKKYQIKVRAGMAEG